MKKHAMFYRRNNEIPLILESIKEIFNIKQMYYLTSRLDLNLLRSFTTVINSVCRTRRLWGDSCTRRTSESCPVRRSCGRSQSLPNQTWAWREVRRAHSQRTLSIKTHLGSIQYPRGFCCYSLTCSDMTSSLWWMMLANACKLKIDIVSTATLWLSLLVPLFLACHNCSSFKTKVKKEAHTRLCWFLLVVSFPPALSHLIKMKFKENSKWL